MAKPIVWIATVLATATVVGAVGAIVQLPGWLAARAVEDASRRGIALEIQSVTLLTLAFPQVRVRGLTARLRDVPQLVLTAPEASVSFGGAVTLRNATLRLDGPLAELVAAVRSTSLPGLGSGEGTVAASGNVDAHELLGLGSGAKATFDVTMSATSFEAKFGGVVVTKNGGTFGPWSAHVTGTPGVFKGALLLEPAGAARVDVNRDSKGLTVALHLPRRTPRALGVDPVAVGLPRALELEAELRGVIAADSTAVDAFLTLQGIELAGLPLPSPLRVQASAAGDPRGPVKLAPGSSASIGPLRADLTGLVEVFPPLGLRADLTWHLGPVPCPLLPGPTVFRGGLHVDTRGPGAAGAGGAAWLFRIDAAQVCGVPLVRL